LDKFNPPTQKQKKKAVVRRPSKYINHVQEYSELSSSRERERERERGVDGEQYRREEES